jgi:hypothetical protein
MLVGMFYLIGVNHNAQSHPPGATLDKHQTELQLCLNESIDACHPKLIAIEESEDTLFVRNGVADESIPRNIARQHAIESMLCEPSNDEKVRIGYRHNSDICQEMFVTDLLRNCPPNLEQAAVLAVEIATMFPLRESFWIEKLKDHLQMEVIFVLGENHIDSFSCRLRALGVQSKVLFRGIGVAEARIAEFEAARRFPIENPELFCAMLQGIRRKQ